MNNLPTGFICSTQDYQQSQTDPTIRCLARGDSIGLTITAEAGLLSLLAVLYVFLIIGRNVLWRFQHMSAARSRIFHQPMDILLFSLFVADAVQAVGMAMSLKWVQDGKVEAGSFCTAQGLVKMYGATGVALSTLVSLRFVIMCLPFGLTFGQTTQAIALYTFIGVWMMKGISSMRTTVVVVIVIWLSTGLLGVTALATHSSPSKPLMLPTPYWCWVSGEYMEWRVLGEYVWMWITLFFSLLVYIPLYLWMRGIIVFRELSWWRFSLPTSPDPLSPSRARRRRSLVMLVYPLVYSLGIMPLSVVRWMTFVEEARNGVNTMPSAATLASEAIFGLSGFCNVILLLTTKPESGLFGQLMFISPARPPYRDERSTDDEYRLGKLTSTGGTSL